MSNAGPAAAGEAAPPYAPPEGGPPTTVEIPAALRASLKQLAVPLAVDVDQNVAHRWMEAAREVIASIQAAPIRDAGIARLRESQQALRDEHTVATAEREALSIQVQQGLNLATAAQAAAQNGGAGRSGSYPDMPMFGGTTDTRTWITQLRNKLRAQPTRYSTEEARLRYAFSRLDGGALDSVRHFMSEETGDVALASLSDLLTILLQNFDNPNRVATAQAKMKSLKHGTGSLMTYLASFRQWIADLPDVREEAMKVWLWDGLLSQLKDALAARETDCRCQSLPAMIDICKDVDTWNRERAQERSLERATATSSSSSSRVPASSGPAPASVPAARPAAVTGESRVGSHLLL
jgi:hypothetical protein